MFYRANRRRVSFPQSLGLSDVGPEITKQSHKAECDIHNILRQYQRTGIITHVQAARPTYQDLPDAVDFQQAMNTLMAAQEAFAGLPARVRAHFNNDPETFLAAFQDKAQEAKLREFGLLKELPVQPDNMPKAPPGAAEGATAPST